MHRLWSSLFFCNVVIINTPDGLEGTDRPSRKSLDGFAGQSLADDRFFISAFELG